MTSKRANDLEKAELDRQAIDSAINDQMRVEGFGSNFQIMRNPEKTLSRQLFIHGAPSGLFFDYRFYPDPLYLKLPGGIRDLRQGLEAFKDHAFLPIKRVGRLIYFHAPIRISDIPELHSKKPEQCFKLSSSPGNENRVDCVVMTTKDLLWVPFGGDPNALMEPEAGITDSIRSYWSKHRKP